MAGSGGALGGRAPLMVVVAIVLGYLTFHIVTSAMQAASVAQPAPALRLPFRVRHKDSPPSPLFPPPPPPPPLSPSPPPPPPAPAASPCTPRNVTKFVYNPLGLDVSRAWPGPDPARYPLTAEAYDYSRRASPGDTTAWHRVLLRAERGDHIGVHVIGGSMTHGQRCGMCGKVEGANRCIDFNECAWPQRLGAWLQQVYPAGNVEVVNHAKGAYNSIVGSSHIDDLFQSGGSVDLVLVDFAVNDIFVDEARQLESTRALTHELVSLPSHPAVVYSATYNGDYFTTLNRSCIRNTTESRVHSPVIIGKLHLPVVSFVDAVCRGRRKVDEWELLWPRYRRAKHPPWQTHQYYADLFADAWATERERMCARSDLDSLGTVGAQTGAGATGVDEAEEDMCSLHSFMMRSDRVAADPATATSPTRLEGWALFEDAPGKPGWIATGPGSQLAAELEVGPRGIVEIEFLRTYINIGTAEFWLTDGAGKATPRVALHGWDALQVSIPVLHRLHHPPGKYQFHLELLPATKANTVGTNKFKLLSLQSC